VLKDEGICLNCSRRVMNMISDKRDGLLYATLGLSRAKSATAPGARVVNWWLFRKAKDLVVLGLVRQQEMQYQDYK